MGIYSKKKRELTFVDIDSIFSMSQKVRKVEAIARAVNADLSEKIITKSNYIDNKAQLIEDFGTLKAKKQTANYLSNIVTEDNIASAETTKKIFEDNAKAIQELSNPDNVDQQLNAKIKSMQEILPPFNLEANKPENIFSIDTSK